MRTRLRARLWSVTRLLGVAALFLALWMLSTCSPDRSLYEELQVTGKLRVAMVNQEGSFFTNPQGELDGFDYVLAQRAAEDLGLELEIVEFAQPGQALEAIDRGDVHFAAAGLAESPQRLTRYRFAPTMRAVTPQLVYRRGSRRPRDLTDLPDTVLTPSQTATADLLAADYSEEDFDWEATTAQDAQGLAYQVGEGVHPLAAIPSDVVKINRRYYPRLAVAFDLADPLRISWVFPDQSDSSLFNRVIAFIESQRASGELARTVDRYYGQLGRLDYVGSRAFSRDVRNRLPRYEARFKQAAEQYGLDWRLLAAVGYQESRWDPDAVSPTGVRGLMMLTQDTARYLNVSNRLSPTQSIDGGARYLREQINRLPKSVKEPDRTWMALAAYNLGMGHVLDGRRLTEAQGGDPDRWVDLRSYLPLLAQARWHKQTRYGYARGYEAVSYVGNIRTYFDILAWLNSGETDAVPQTEAPAAPPEEPPEEPRKPEDAVLDIDSPIL